MDKDTIKKLYQAKAQLKQMHFTDPLRPMVEQAIGALEEEYAQHIDEVNSDEKSKTSNDVPWEPCLQYVAQLFNTLNNNQEEENHIEQVKFRQMVWTIVSNGVSNYYCQKKPEA